MTKRDPLLDALAEARHDDPFGVLGPHVDPNGVVIRACLPTAERVAVARKGSAAVVMKRRHAAGVFEASIPGLQTIPDYRLDVTYAGARQAIGSRATSFVYFGCRRVKGQLAGRRGAGA